MELYDSLTDFLDTGGNVLSLILWVSISLWALISERLFYLHFAYPQLQRQWLAQGRLNGYDHPRTAFYIRQGILSEARISMEKSLGVIKMLIGICPMLGLLGTVTGMIDVFDVMAVTGSSNARAMAAGISEATVSTMAGMVIAISGLYFHQLIEKNIKDKVQQLAIALKQ